MVVTDLNSLSKEELIEMGQNEEEAEKNAVEQMGDAEIIGKELNKVE